MLMTDAAQSLTTPVTRIVMVASPGSYGAARSPASEFKEALLQTSVWPTTESGATEAPAYVTAAGSTSVSTM